MNPLSRLAQAFYPVPDDAKSLSALANVPELQHSNGGWIGDYGKAIINSAVSGFTLPRDVYQGKVDLNSDKGFGRVMDLSGLAMTGGLGGTPMQAGEVALGSGPVIPKWIPRSLSDRRIPDDLFLNPALDGAIDKPYVYYSTNRPMPPQARDLGEIRDRALGSDRPLTLDEIAAHELVAVNEPAQAEILKQMYDIKSGGKSRGYEFIRNPGSDWQGVSITPSAKEPGQYQASYYDKRGFSSDSQHPDLIDALRRAASDGYHIPQPGALAAAMKKFGGAQ